MNRPIRRFVFSLSMFSLIFGLTQANSPQELQDPYLGQKPPGITAELFAPDVLSKYDSVGCSGFLNGGTLFVFSTMKRGTDWRLKPTYVMGLKNGKWTEPTIAPFNSYMPYNFTVGPA